jgi:uncharacterized protein YgbK (DUF1537 family)
MPIALIIADDLTGAADTGVQFATRGWRSLLALDPSGTSAADILSIYADSRNLPSAGAAAQAVRQLVSALRTQPAYHELNAGFRLIYKKIDSTLRGYPAAELAALMDALGDTRVVIAPAYPPQGRTTLNAIQHLNGLPLEQTSFAGDIHHSNLLELFSQSMPVPALLPLSTIRKGQPAVSGLLSQVRGPIIADAETHQDLVILARAVLTEGIRVCCGSAGFAAALVECMAPPSATQPLTFSPRIGSILAVAGSLNPTTHDQVSHAALRGIAVVQPAIAIYQKDGETALQTAANQVLEALAAGRAVILVTPTERLAQAAGQIPFAARMAEIVRRVLIEAPPGGLLLNGGDTARAICAWAGCTRIWLGSQLEPGIPWGLMADGCFPGLPVVTKAGGFGKEDSLERALNFLQSGKS